MSISNAKFWGLAGLLLCIILKPVSAQYILGEPSISYQGCLQNASGDSVPDGTYDITTRLHLSDLTTVWTHDFTDVNVVGCIYNLRLGRAGTNPLPKGALWDTDVYLEVTVDGTTLSPPTLLSGSPMAFGLVLPIEASANHTEALLSINNNQVSSRAEESPSGIYGSTAANTSQLLTDNSYGVKGEALSATGFSNGVMGITASYNGAGVVGVNTTPEGEDTQNNNIYPPGVYGRSQSTTGRGVYGRVNNAPNSQLIFGPFSAGVYGESTASEGRSHGVFGSTNSLGGRAFYGVHNNGGYAAWFEGHAQIRDGDLEVRNGLIEVLNGSNETIVIDPDEAGSGTGAIKLYNGNDVVIELDASFGGDGRVITEEIQITGGSDLSETFDVSAAPHLPAPEPGMVVAIDPEQPGRLELSTSAYNPMVAGIISGAGGIETGMIMGQEGSIADGDHPVALAGRVYVHADASTHPIRPGDLLTTADLPGHAMKVTEPSRAHGAILGKAMTGLATGQGLVLALVSLQ